MEMFFPSISIVIPMYNVEQYIEECLNSVLTQITEQDEVIIIDDGSSDNSRDICQSVVSDYKNVRVIEQSNHGKGKARNVGIDMARCDYIMFLDADDYYQQCTIQTIKNTLCDCPVDVLLFDAETINETTDVYFQRNPYDRNKFAYQDACSGIEMFSKLYPRFYLDSSCLMAVKRDFLNKNSLYFPVRMIHEDVSFTFHLFILATKMRHLSHKIYVRRYRVGSTRISPWSERNDRGIFRSTCQILRIISFYTKTRYLNSFDINYVMQYAWSRVYQVIQLSSKGYIGAHKKSFLLMIAYFLNLWIGLTNVVKDSHVIIHRTVLLYWILCENRLFNQKICHMFQLVNIHELEQKDVCIMKKVLEKIPFREALIKSSQKQRE